ncbi:MAG TPA: hypothetical protein VK524_31895 [Polyangiaceae bacterium]|nr:hypothetical protein [Polyangiaceae bacterium]
MTPDSQALRNRFDGALIAAGVAASPTDMSDAVFDDLVARHGEPHRHYHTLRHVSACLEWLDRFYGLAERPEEVELALWFHDAIYDPRAPDNELRSAGLARSALSGLGVPSEAVGRVWQHIEATQHHQASNCDSALVVDLDLTILGAAPHAFARFEQQIRVEYAHVQETVFRAGRARVLESFSSRSEIFRAVPIRELLETRARANLERRIQELHRQD